MSEWTNKTEKPEWKSKWINKQISIYINKYEQVSKYIKEQVNK